MKRLILFALVAGLTVAGLYAISDASDPIAASDLETLQVANHLYSNGEYAHAAQLYQQLVDSGIRSADIYYNLGNTYFQLDDMGRAILNYTRAQHLAPRDATIKSNLQLALNRANINPAAGSPIDRLVDATDSRFTLNELALLALASTFAVLWLWMASRRIEPSRIRQLVTMALVVSVVWFAANTIALAATLYNQETQPYGIVLAQTPVGGVSVASGTEVHILEQRDETVLVALPGRNEEGWVTADSIGTI